MKTREAQSIEAKHPISESVRKRNPHLYPAINQLLNHGGEDDDEHALIEVMTSKKPKRIRQSSKPLMNKLETEYLDVLISKLGGESAAECGIYCQAIRFKLGNGISYKPDFVRISYTQAPVAWEVKGPHSFRGGFENLKVAAFQYPRIKFFLVWKENGVWREQEVLP